MTTTISGFIHYKDANTKEIYFESINIGSKTYILNKVKDDLNKYMITMDGSEKINETLLSNIMDSINLNKTDEMNDISTAQNSLIGKLKTNISINNFLNSIEKSSLWVNFKQNIENLNKLLELQKQYSLSGEDEKAVDELISKYVKSKKKLSYQNKIEKIIKRISTDNQKIISNGIINKEYPDIINFLFFMLKTENINLITIFNNCTLDVTNALIEKCINNTGIININRVFFFTIIYNENEITDMHINNKSLHKALDLQEALDNNSNTIYGQLNSYIEFLLKTDSTIDEKVTLIMDKFETTSQTDNNL